MTAETHLRRPGRPRSERAEKAIIEATLDLLAEEPGVAGVSIEAVAARAGVGKTTIYRRWPNKEALIIDALASLKAPLPEVEGLSVRADLIALGQAMVGEYNSKHSRCMWNVMGGAEKHPQLLEQFEAQVMRPRKEVFRRVLAGGIERGELRDDLDLDVARFLLIGALTLRGRSMSDIPPLAEDFVEKVVDTLLFGLAPR
ncbi:TetR/AcrR family transcriptional regulator [Actinocorallia longicatena]|uniref:TetR/AcrR family transcriptional regulator n=1 Tax=Actinocorallia longicatena TaxID=111803 RepID=A0ABP6QAR7_9ACTN